LEGSKNVSGEILKNLDSVGNIHKDSPPVKLEELQTEKCRERLLFNKLVTVGVVSVCRLKRCFSLHTDTTPPQPNHKVTPTHIEPEEYNP